MRNTIMIIVSVFVFVALNYGIYEKETIAAQGTQVLLELAPVDPRSLMQGDYMRLRYKVALDAKDSVLKENLKRGYLVIKTSPFKVK